MTYPRALRRSQGGIPAFDIIERSGFYRAITTLMILSFGGACSLLAFKGDLSLWAQWSLVDLLRVLLWIQVAEVVLALLAEGPRRFLRNGWNLFDAAVLSAALTINPVIGILRLFRVMRIFRLVSAAPQYRRVLEGAIGSLSGVLAFTVILSFVLSIFVVLGVGLFAHDEPRLFGNARDAFVTLISIASLNAWDDPIVREFLRTEPGAWPFLLSTTVLLHFLALGLAAAVVSDAVQRSNSAELKAFEDSINNEGGSEP